MASTARARSPAGSTAGSTRGGASSSHHEGPGHRDRDDDRVKVELYWGDKGKLRFFLTQLRAFYTLNRNRYSDAKSQVLYAGLALRGNAFAWFEPILTDYLTNNRSDQEQETQNIFADFDNFETSIKLVFGVANEERAAERMIHQVEQRGSAAQYWSQFQQVASKLAWSDEVLLAIFYAGLKRDIKEKMINNKPTTYQTMVQKAIDIDNELFELRRGGYNPYKGHGVASARPKYQRNYGDPMELDAMQERRPSRPKQRGFQRSGNNAERERRRRDNLCYNCGKSGHQARECKGTPHTLHMMTVKEDEITAGMVGQKADTTMGTEPKSSSQKSPEAQKGPDTEKGHARGKKDTPPKTTIPHEFLSWTACHDDYCLTHKSDKDGSGWYPTRPKNHGKKKRAAPSWYQPQDSDQEPDTPMKAEDKEGRDSLQMMNARRSPRDPPSWEESQREHTKNGLGFTITYSSNTCLIFRTKLYGLKQEGGIRHPTFWPTGRPGGQEVDVIIRRCMDTQCHYWKMAHSHDIMGQEYLAAEGAGLFPSRDTLSLMKARAPIPKKDLPRTQEDLDRQRQRESGKRVQERSIEHTIEVEALLKDGAKSKEPSLAELNMEQFQEPCVSDTRQDTESDEEGEYPTPEPDLPDPGTDRKFVVVATTKDSITMVTNYWRRAQCTNSECDLDTQHVHAIFDPTALPKEYVRLILLHYCTDFTCDYAPQLHIHQGNDSDIADLQIPESVAYTIWGHVQPNMHSVALANQIYERQSPAEQLNMMVERIGCIDMVIDEVADHAYIAEYFECNNVNCGMYFQDHKHTFNVDPDHPKRPIKPRKAQKMIDQGYVCEEQECEWRQYLHVHFPKNL
ncbi:Zinc finger, CCHC-type [Lasallia pustulata]|uniref:Zinc finger, CCHC-type n=1 Tax=Lasallia pustulata TaxID=136370 RepID=A0A1W5CYV1_9LECA|nr:Zinc finger, CCHC-type [Lasallia pustulata]